FLRLVEILRLQGEMNLPVTQDIGLDFRRVNPNDSYLRQSLADYLDRHGLFLSGVDLVRIEADDHGSVEPVATRVARLEERLENLAELERGFVRKHPNKGAHS